MFLTQGQLKYNRIRTILKRFNAITVNHCVSHVACYWRYTVCRKSPRSYFRRTVQRGGRTSLKHAGATRSGSRGRRRQDEDLARGVTLGGIMQIGFV